MDIDIYDEDSNKLDVQDMPLESPIKITIGRMKSKDTVLGVLTMPDPIRVNVTVSYNDFAERKRRMKTKKKP